MAARTKKQEQINLLPQKGFEATTTGRILAWVLSTFRVIVIVTEIIVMIAFLSRFWLDAQNADLNEEIETKQGLLTASLSFENNFRNVQKRLSVLSEITTAEGDISNSLRTTVSYLPDDLYLSTYSYESGKFTIEGVTPNEQSIQQLIVNLLNSKIFDTVSLQEVKTAVSSPDVLTFKLGATPAKKEGVQ